MLGYSILRLEMQESIQSVETLGKSEKPQVATDRFIMLRLKAYTTYFSSKM